MKTLQISSFGSPTDVVELTEIEPDEPGPGQLAVAIEAAPINPSDLTLIKGVYGVRPELPAAVGAEGVGRVVAVGDCVDAARIGERVLVVPTLEQATWREQTVLDERNAILVDADGDPLQLAMLGINPITAYCLLHGYVKFAPGAWVAQTGASSATAVARSDPRRLQNRQQRSPAPSVRSLERRRGIRPDRSKTSAPPSGCFGMPASPPRRRRRSISPRSPNSLTE